MPTTNERVRRRLEEGKLLSDGATRNTATDDPGNGADTVVGEDTDVHIVNPDGTNTVDLSNAEAAGRTVTIVHNGGASTPTIAFDDGDFVGTGPSDIASTGATATVLNTDGSASGWAVIATGSA